MQLCSPRHSPNVFVCVRLSVLIRMMGWWSWWWVDGGAEDKGIEGSQIVSQSQLIAAAEFQTDAQPSPTVVHFTSTVPRDRAVVRGTPKGFCPAYVRGCIKNSAGSVYSWVVCRRVNTAMWQFIFKCAR